MGKALSIEADIPTPERWLSDHSRVMRQDLHAPVGREKSGTFVKAPENVAEACKLGELVIRFAHLEKAGEFEQYSGTATLFK